MWQDIVVGCVYRLCNIPIRLIKITPLNSASIPITQDKEKLEASNRYTRFFQKWGVSFLSTTIHHGTKNLMIYLNEH